MPILKGDSSGTFSSVSSGLVVVKQKDLGFSPNTYA